MSRILVVDDELQIRRALDINLRTHGYEIDLAETGEEALTRAAAHPPDLVLLDLGLPGIDGIDVIRGLRGWSAVPIIVLSARDGDPSKVAALDAGADDYVTKPFGIGELLARVRAALRHAVRGASGDARLALGIAVVDLERRTAKRGDEEVRLTPIEYRLLATLARHAGKVLTHRQLLQEVWGPGHAEAAHYLRVYMGQLRRKLEPDPARPRYLLTELGVGYRLAEE